MTRGHVVERSRIHHCQGHGQGIQANGFVLVGVCSNDVYGVHKTLSHRHRCTMSILPSNDSYSPVYGLDKLWGNDCALQV